MKKICLVLVLVIVACKNSKKEEINTIEEKPKVIEESVFKIKMEFINNNDDKFEIYYQDDNHNKYTRENRIAKGVKGNVNPQKVEFKLPEKVFPTSIRIDVGEGLSENEITFISLVMTYEDYKKTFSPLELMSFFNHNQFIEYSKNTGLIKCKSVNGKYDPFFSSKEYFNKELELDYR